MDKNQALHNLLNGTASEEEIGLLRQLLASGEISIGRDVNRSVVIIGSGNKVELTAEALGILNPKVGKDTAPAKGESPYMGLRYFDTQDADLFYGREALSRELLERVKQESFLAIVGASGSGKSSVARAGLIPLWKQENERGAIYVITPTARPLECLAACLTRESESVTVTSTLMDDLMKDARSLRLYVKKALGETKLLLLVDQFEETFTLCKDGAERKAFIENLLTLADAEADGAARVVITLRADFYHHCAEYEGLRNALKTHQEYIGAMTTDELRQAITTPAETNGWDFQPGLVDLILQDVGTEPGALPLLSHALLETWKRRQGRTLTLQGYHEAGGVKKAITQTAESVYDNLTPAEQTIARGIFLRLTELGEGVQDTRRRVKMDELGQAKEQDAVTKVLKTLTDARLVTTEENSAEVAHEALIREWGTLRKWLDEDRESLRLHRHLTESTQEWERAGRDDLFLIHRGGRLVDALLFKENSIFELNSIEQTYLNACVALQNKEQRERERRLRWTVIASVTAAVIFFVLGGFGWVKSNEAVERANDAATAQAKAEEGAKIARVGELKAQSIAKRENNFLLSLLLGIETYNKFDNAETRAVVLENAQTNPQLFQYYPYQAGYKSATFNPDGEILAFGNSDGTIALFDTLNNQLIGQSFKVSEGSIDYLVFSPDGKLLAFSSYGAIFIWDIASKRIVGQPFIHSSGALQNMMFSSDSKTLDLGFSDSTLVLWNVETQQRITQSPIMPGNKYVESVAFSRDGNIAAMGSCEEKGDNLDICLQGDILLWDVTAQKTIGQVIKGHSSYVYALTFSPDGRTLASGSADGTIILWDIASQKPISPLLTPSSSHLMSLAFSSDGKTLISGSGDGSITFWNVDTLQPIGQALKGHSSQVDELILSQDGKTLLSQSYMGGEIIVWKLTISNPLARPFSGHTDWVTRLAFSPNGKILATGSPDNTILLWDSTQGLPTTLKGHNGVVMSLAFSPDSKALVSGSADGTIILWDIDKGTSIGDPIAANKYGVASVAFSPDGSTLFSGGCRQAKDYGYCTEEEIILWDVKTHNILGYLKYGDHNIKEIIFSPNGKIIAASNDDGMVYVWDSTTRQPIGQPFKGPYSELLGIEFASDSKMLKLYSKEGVVLWDFAAQSFTMSQPFVDASYSFYNGVKFLPDGRTIISFSSGRITLWDNVSRKAIGQLYIPNKSGISSMTVSPNGTLATGGCKEITGKESCFKGEVIYWDVSLDSWIKSSCQRAGRNFTYEEWMQYFPDEEYRATCPQWPLFEPMNTTATP